MSLCARRRALVIAGSSVIAGCTLMAPAYAAVSGHSAATAASPGTAGPQTPAGGHVQPGGVSHLIGPRTVHTGTKNATTTSTNWSGYAATGGPYTSVSSSWVEPTGKRGHPAAGRLRPREIHRGHGQRVAARQFQSGRDHHGVRQRCAGGQHLCAHRR